MKVVLKVEGMSCSHCEAHVKEALEAVEGVASAKASAKKCEAVVKLTADVPVEKLVEAVVAAGYNATPAV